VGNAHCELRSVNHRYLELSLRLPEDLRGLEGDARALLSGVWRRGKVDAGVYLRGGAAAAPAVEINRPLVEQLLAGAAVVRGLAGGAAGPVDALEVLRWPGVIRDTERDVAPVATAAMELLAETATGLNEARSREGARIREMLVQRCERCAIRWRRCARGCPRWRPASAPASPSGWRSSHAGSRAGCRALAAEITLLAYKMDVEEELDRLGSHITETLQVLDSSEPCRPPTRLPDAGVQPRGEHAVVEVAGHRDHPRRRGHEGADRADAGAGAER